MARKSSFQCTGCDHEWEGKPTWDRSSPPRCSECKASGGKINIVHEPPEIDDPDRQLEAELVARLRNGETPLDLVESGAASLEEAKQVMEELDELEDIRILEKEEIDELESEAYDRGKHSRDKEVKTLRAEIRRLRRQLEQSNSTIQQWSQRCELLEQRNQRQSEQLTQLQKKTQRVDDLETKLKLERDKRERAERKLEEFKDSVNEEMVLLREAHEERQQELRNKNKKLRENNRRIDELEELLVDDIAEVAATARVMGRRRVGVGPGLVQQGV